MARSALVLGFVSFPLLCLFTGRVCANRDGAVPAVADGLCAASCRDLQ